MYIRNPTLIVIGLAVMFSTNVMAKEIAIYRWVDENNVVHFSQHQPQNSNYSQLTTFASYQAKQKSANTQPESTQSPSVDEQLAKHEKEQAEIAEKNRVITEKNCKAAKLNIKMLNSFSKVTILGTDGENRVLSNKEKKAQMELSNKHVDLYCNKQ
jgi:hypothetical protein